jgi:hypothetical protein
MRIRMETRSADIFFLMRCGETLCTDEYFMTNSMVIHTTIWRQYPRDRIHLE